MIKCLGAGEKLTKTNRKKGFEETWTLSFFAKFTSYIMRDKFSSVGERMVKTMRAYVRIIQLSLIFFNLD